MKTSTEPDFYHAMVYVTDVERALDFYVRLGLDVVESRQGYARLRCPKGIGSLALHAAEDRRVDAAGIRLYFEVDDLYAYCQRLDAEGIELDQAPKQMEWGWHHAYLRDPDGHELGLYHAGSERLTGQPEVAV
jgi:catechol 2,3-dioxygenase-like lactoylglutathione lyase family enzyme